MSNVNYVLELNYDRTDSDKFLFLFADTVWFHFAHVYKLIHCSSPKNFIFSSGTSRTILILHCSKVPLETK